MNRRTILNISICLILIVAVNAHGTAQSKDETKIRIKTVKVDKGDTTMTEQTLTPEEFEALKQKGEFKDLDIQMKKGKAAEKGEKITKEIRVTKKEKQEAGEQVEVEITESEHGKKVVKTLKGKEAEEYLKHKEHSDHDHDHKGAEKKVTKEKKVIKKKE